MNKKDITNDWVIENFDLDKERNVKTDMEERYTSLDMFDSGLSVEDTKKAICSALDDLVNPEAKKTSVYVDDWDDIYDELRETLEIKVVNEIERPETDKEVISRIKSREKQKIKKIENKQKQEDKKEQYERRMYEKLKKKFEQTD